MIKRIIKWLMLLSGETQPPASMSVSKNYLQQNSRPTTIPPDQVVKKGTCKCYHRWREYEIGHHCWGCNFDIVPAHDLHFVIIDYSATRQEDRVRWKVNGRTFIYLSKAAEYLSSNAGS